MNNFCDRILKCKSVATCRQDIENPLTKLKKVLGPWYLMALGIGAIIFGPKLFLPRVVTGIATNFTKFSHGLNDGQLTTLIPK